MSFAGNAKINVSNDGQLGACFILQGSNSTCSYSYGYHWICHNFISEIWSYFCGFYLEENAVVPNAIRHLGSASDLLCRNCLLGEKALFQQVHTIRFITTRASQESRERSFYHMLINFNFIVYEGTLYDILKELVCHKTISNDQISQINWTD